MVKIEMDLTKYDNAGFGLSREAFTHLFNILEDMESPINVIDWGSGISTQFLYDYKELSGKEMIIDSFDDSPVYKHQNATLVPLVECSDEDFNKMFEEKRIWKSWFTIRNIEPTSRQRNCFYDVRDIELNNYDLVILDGPNGNGRSLAFLHLIDKLNKDAIVYIDDTTARDDDFEYDFCGRFNSIFDAEELVVHEVSNSNSFRIYKVRN